MRYIRLLFIGILFGFVLSKSEAISWFRIQEMFRFQSFHMYGIMSVAVMVGASMIMFLKRTSYKTVMGDFPDFKEKPKTYWASILGGICFGLGWAMTGACPGPLYILLGHGLPVVLVIIASALIGTFCYGLLRSKLPH